MSQTFQSQTEAMDAILARINLALNQAYADVGSTSSFFGLGGVKQSSLDALNNYTLQTNALGDDLYHGVLDGSTSFDAWMDAAKTVWEGVESEDKAVGDWSFANVSVNTVKATGNVISSAASSVASGSKFFMIAAIVALALIFLIKVT